MYDTVSNGINLLQALDRACLVVDKCLDHKLDCLLMCWHICLSDLLIQTGLLIYKSAVIPIRSQVPLQVQIRFQNQ